MEVLLLVSGFVLFNFVVFYSLYRFVRFAQRRGDERLDRHMARFAEHLRGEADTPRPRDR